MRSRCSGFCPVLIVHLSLEHCFNSIDKLGNDFTRFAREFPTVALDCIPHGSQVMAENSIHDEMLSDMPAMRLTLGRHFKWYYHVTPIKNIASIRMQGLQPKPDMAAPEVVVKYAGQKASEIICLNPLGADAVPPPVQEGPFACLAICREALPFRIGLDWSHAGGFGIAEVLRTENSARPANSIFVEAAKRWGSIIAYDPIPATSLRAYRRGRMPHDPARWPFLTTATDDELETF